MKVYYETNVPEGNFCWTKKKEAFCPHYNLNAHGTSCDLGFRNKFVEKLNGTIGYEKGGGCKKMKKK